MVQATAPPPPPPPPPPPSNSGSKAMMSSGDSLYSGHLQPREQLPGVQYCITSPPSWPHALLLGFQHYFVALGTAVLIPSLLVPHMGGDNNDKARVIQTLIFATGINTLLQSLFGTRLPVVMGGSYAFIVPILTIISSDRLQAIPDQHQRFLHTMRAIQGALITASIPQIVLGVSGVWGVLARFISPLVAAPLVGLAGLGLYNLGFPAVAKCIEIGLPQLIVLVIFSQYLKYKGKNQPLERYCILFTVPFVWAYAHLLTVGGAYKRAPLLTQEHCRTDISDLVAASPWLSIPYPLQWGSPTFDSAHTFAIISSVLVAAVESIGGFWAAMRFASATPPPPFVVSRGIGWQGMAILLDGLLGTLTGSTVSIENAGLLGVTNVGSRRVTQVAAGFLIFFSLFGKFGAVLASVPAPIVGAIFCLLFSKVVGCGLSFLQFVHMNERRNLFILGFSVYMGISVPFYFAQYAASAGHGPVTTGSRWFNDFVFVAMSSGAAVALVVALALDLSVPGKDAEKHSGRGFWAKFWAWDGDSRNKEFYSLPFRMNEFWER